MKASTRLALIATLGLVIIALGSWTMGPKTNAPPSSTTTVPPQQNTPAQSLITDRDAAFLQTLSKTHPQVPRLGTSLPKTFVASFQRLQAMSDYFNRDALRRREMAEILDRPGAVDLALTAVTDLDLAQKIFGEDQALVRVYAIKLLAEAARLGNARPLHDAVTTLSSRLDEDAKSGIPIRKAQDRDLADLLDAAVKPVDRATLKSDLESVLTDLGYRRDFSPVVRKAFDDAVFFPLLGEVGREQAKILVAAALGDAA